MIRVGLVCGHLGLGGQEVAILDLLRRLDRSRFRPFLYSFRPGPMLGAARELDVPVVVGHDRPPEDPTWTDVDRAAATRFRRSLALHLRRDRIDACLIFAWPDALAAAREAGVRAIIERVDGPSLARRLHDKSSCRRIICESEAVRALLLAQRELLRVVPERLRIIRNGIDLRRFDPARYDRGACRRALGLGERQFAVGAVARLAPQKNLGHLLEAVRVLVDRTPGGRRRIKAFLVGPDDGARAQLEKQARRLRLGNTVRFLGPREDVPEILRALDVFVLPSLYEGTSRAVLESMAMGLPLVVSELAAMAELMDGNGYLVGVLDPHQTWMALDELLHDPGLRDKLGRRSRHLARQHDVAAMVRRYETVLTESVREAGRDGRFARRIGFAADPGHPRERTALAPLVSRLRAGRLDAHLLEAPPARGKQTVRMRRAAVRRTFGTVDPDAVVIRSPQLARWLARLLGGDELLFWPRSAMRGRGAREALELADRVVFASEGRRRRAACRWPEWQWKFAPVALPPRAPDLAARLKRILSTPRPVPPDGREAAR